MPISGFGARPRWQQWWWPSRSTLACGLTAALAAGVAVGLSSPLDVDRTVRAFLSAHQSSTGQRVAALLTQLGAGPVLYPLLLASCLLEARVRRSAWTLLPLAVLGTGQVLEAVLFAAVHPASPAGLAERSLTGTFSSGHASAALLGWGLIGRQGLRLLSLSGGRVEARPARDVTAGVWWTGLAVGLAVASTRVYLGLHWLSDVLVGLAAGGCLLWAGVRWLRRWDCRLPDRLDRLDPDQAAAENSAAAGGRAATLGGMSMGKRCLEWARTSPWAWAIPLAAAAVPVGALLLAPDGERLKDLLVYQGAGEVVGAGRDLYAFRTAWSMPFTYPPFAALLIEPLGRMPLGAAQTAWTLATLAAVVALARAALQPVVNTIGLPLTVTALLVSSPVRSHLRFGQVGVFLVLLVALDLLRRGRGGWGLGLATAVKLTPVVFLPWLLVTGQRARLAAALGWAAAASLLGLLLLWPSSGDYLLRASRDISRFGPNGIPGNQSVRGMLLRALPAQSAEWVWLVCAVLLLGVGTYNAWRLERVGNRLAAVGLLAALSVAVSPISWVHHLVWLVLPMSALAAAGRLRLLCVWFLVLTVSLPSVGHSAAVAFPTAGWLWALVTDAQGLTAVAAVLLLPALVAGRTGDRQRGLGDGDSSLAAADHERQQGQHGYRRRTRHQGQADVADIAAGVEHEDR